MKKEKGHYSNIDKAQPRGKEAWFFVSCSLEVFGRSLVPFQRSGSQGAAAKSTHCVPAVAPRRLDSYVLGSDRFCSTFRSQSLGFLVGAPRFKTEFFISSTRRLQSLMFYAIGPGRGLGGSRNERAYFISFFFRRCLR